MKKTIITLIFGLFLQLSMYAQPSKFNYQGIARNSAGAPLASTTLGLRISILDLSATGTILYRERHLPVTNAYGLYNVAIGEGTVIDGSMAAIDWGTGDKYISVEIDPSGGTSYTTLGTSQLLSVPYALYAASGTPGPAGLDGTNGKTIINGTTPPSSTLGTDGDFYLNTTSSTLYGPKTASGWGTGVSLVGPAGAAGATGATGAAGAAGTNGKTILNGTIVPGSTTGTVGDFYLRTTNNVLYGPKTASGWGTGVSLVGPAGASGATGASGTNGKTILNGTTVPATTAGTVGDFYLRTTNNVLYGPKTASGWGTGVSLVGPAGASGTTFTTGTGLSLAAGVLSATNTTALWNANQLRGVNISSTAPTANQFLRYTGTNWTPTTVAIPTVTGTTNYIPKFTAASTLANSQIFDNGTSVGINIPTPVSNYKLHLVAPSTMSRGIYSLLGDGPSVTITSPNALYGASSTGLGVVGVSETTNAIFGYSSSSDRAGVVGVNNNTGYGVWAVSSNPSGIPIYAETYSDTGRNFVAPNGKMGIGTFNPLARLHINGTMNNTVTLGGITFNKQSMLVTADANDGSATNRGIISSPASTSGNESQAYFAYPRSDGYNVGYFALADGTSSPVANYGFYSNVSGATSTNYAGYFNGQIYATSGTFGTKPFTIDHPLDPENKYLRHSSIESPDMMNVYNGNITTDGEGYATVMLPDYFEALNKDFKYQLTVIGTFAQAIIKEEIADNKFLIQTNQPHVKVSWLVSGVRHDAVAKKFPIIVEEEKVEAHKGKYLEPTAYGQSEELGIHYLPSMKEMKASSTTSNTILPDPSQNIRSKSNVIGGEIIDQN